MWGGGLKMCWGSGHCLMQRGLLAAPRDFQPLIALWAGL